MVTIKFLTIALFGVACTLATPVAEPAPFNVEARRAPGSSSELVNRAVTPSSTGYHNGFYYSFWSDGTGNVDYSNGPGGSYNVSWSGSSHWIGGKGWNPGSARTINYAAGYRTNGYSALGVYGWTTDPLVQYFVIENFGTLNPAAGAIRKGSVDTDGGTYEIYAITRYNQPSIQGTATFAQFWSVRRLRRLSGTITMRHHFEAWKKYGMNIGLHDYQIFAGEGYFSSGSANVTIS